MEQGPKNIQVKLFQGVLLYLKRPDKSDLTVSMLSARAIRLKFSPTATERLYSKNTPPWARWRHFHRNTQRLCTALATCRLLYATEIILYPAAASLKRNILKSRYRVSLKSLWNQGICMFTTRMQKRFFPSATRTIISSAALCPSFPRATLSAAWHRSVRMQKHAHPTQQNKSSYRPQRHF